MPYRRFFNWTLVRVLLVITILAVGVQTEPMQPANAQTDGHQIFLPLISSQTGGISYPSDMIVVDHTSIALFDSIPDQYIQAAIQLDSLFRHASVGDNINLGLHCLMNNMDYFEEEFRRRQRPASCDSGLTPGEIFYNARYDRTRWVFEFHYPPPGQNPPWWDKLNLFINRVDGLPGNSPYDVVAFKFGYVDSQVNHPIDTFFFARNPNDPYTDVADLEAMIERHPNKVVVLWTMGLARTVGTSISTNFNNQLRNYAIQARLPLMDIADIQSHDPDGNPCVDIEGRGEPALCPHYANPIDGGHLSARGMQRMAKAYWVLMARLAGWNP